jgi:CRISPR/Cas system-associated exonuclease Cas4 (RecB family)
VNLPTEWVAAAAALALLLGLLLVLTGSSLRRCFGLGGGHTVSLDGVTLTSYRLGLTGRPGRLIREDGALIPEERKPARVVRPSHRAQLGVHFLLVEEELRVRPPHGFVVLGDGTRHRVENSQELRAWVLGLAARIRAARAELTRPVPVSPWPGKCRRCGVRDHCSQWRL